MDDFYRTLSVHTNNNLFSIIVLANGFVSFYKNDLRLKVNIKLFSIVLNYNKIVKSVFFFLFI